MWFSHCDPPHVPTEESRTELWRNKLFSPFKFYFWILQSIISYVQGSQTSCAPSLSKAVNRIKQSNESLSQTVCLHNSLSFILHCRGRDHGLNKFLQNTLLKNRVRWLRCFTVMENDTIFLPACIATRNKQAPRYLFWNSQRGFKDQKPTPHPKVLPAPSHYMRTCAGTVGRNMLNTLHGSLEFSVPEQSLPWSGSMLCSH